MFLPLAPCDKSLEMGPDPLIRTLSCPFEQRKLSADFDIAIVPFPVRRYDARSAL